MSIRPGRLFKVTLISGALAAIAIQFVRPARTNPTIDPARTLAAHLIVPPDVAAILDRSCRDCHSSDTRWPWYSNVAPVSWWIIDHVNHGRSHFNASKWAEYGPDEQHKLLKESCELSREGRMPLSSYLWMHDAALNERDRQVLCEWASASAASLQPIAAHSRPGSPSR